MPKVNRGERSAWPLIVVAALSFVPAAGIVAAAAALAWAFVGSRPRARTAVVVAAAGVLFNVAVAVAVMRHFHASREIRAVEARDTRADLNRLVRALDDYHARTGRYPPTLSALVAYWVPERILNIHDHTGGLLGLPRTYRYRVAADGQSYDLYSAGPDGKPHTADDIRPSLPDSLPGGGGYLPAAP